jgi:hypothetical protein
MEADRWRGYILSYILLATVQEGQTVPMGLPVIGGHLLV